MSLQPVDAVFVNTLSSMAATPEPPVVKAATPEPEHDRAMCMCGGGGRGAYVPSSSGCGAWPSFALQPRNPTAAESRP